MYVLSNIVRSENFEVLGTFSSHWAAVAAITRISNPEFKSLGGDSEADLAEEAKMRDRIELIRSTGETNV